MSKSCGPPDYSKYRLRTDERILYAGEGLLIVSLIAYLFYRSWIAWIGLMPLVLLFLRKKKAELAQKQRQELSLQFKDLILTVAANQKAGYSVENAFRESYRDMAMLYGEDAVICRELKYITAGLDNNVTPEKLLYHLGARSGIADIIQFADVFVIAKRSGGSMTEILSKTAEVIEQKTETDKEIQLMLGAKKTEQKIMNIVPFVIIFYVGSTSKGFFDILYHNLLGVVIMTVCLGFYFAAYTLSEKIVNIEV